jgi:hypothetical protein
MDRNKEIAKHCIFSGYARMLDDQRLEAEYKQQLFIKKSFREAGLTYFPLLDALSNELDRRNSQKLNDVV